MLDDERRRLTQPTTNYVTNVIWKTVATGGTPTVFVNSQTLSPQAASGVILVPPFGANGVEFNNEYTEMYVANTAYHSIVEVPVSLNLDGSVALAGPAAVLTTDINAADGIAVDRHDNLWGVANQQDEIDVVDPNAIDAQGDVLSKVVARRGDFEGLAGDGTSWACCSRQVRRSAPTERFLMFSNLALYLPYAGVPQPAIDLPWTLQVKHYTIAAIRAVIPPFPDRDQAGYR